jgi:uncharacterized repeat protein (TIGR01451 family)
MHLDSAWRRHIHACLLFVLLVLGVGPQAHAARAGCADGACVSAGPRLANVSTTQSALLNPLLQGLLPGTSIDLSVADWNALADADIDLNLLLTELSADLGVSDPAQVLNADLGLGQLALVSADLLEADGQTLAASVLRLLEPRLGGLVGTIRLAELLELEFPPRALGNVKLGVLDLLVGWIQLYNFSNVITTPQPITIDTAALALPGIAKVELWAQVVEPPVYVCGSAGSQFYSAAVRAKLNVTAANTAVLDPLVDALDGLSILGLVTVDKLGLGAKVLTLQLYADVARAQGSIAAINALAGSVTLQAQPGLVNLYLGQIDDAIFWNRAIRLSEAVVEPVALTTLQLTADIKALLGIVPLAKVSGDIGVSIKAVAEGSPELRTATVVGPFPATVTMASGSVSVGSLLTSLLDDLELSASGDGLTVTLLGVLPLDLDIDTIVNALVGAVQPLLSGVLVPVLEPLLDLVLGSLVDNLLQLLGIQIGQAVFTVEGLTEACATQLVLALALDPADDAGRFDLGVSQGAASLASLAAAGHGDATSPVFTQPGATYRLSEAAAAGTTLASYGSSWSCVDENDVEVDSGQGTSFDLVAPQLGRDPVAWTCRFTNRTRQAALTLTKSDASTVYVPGGTATYTLTVSNAGPDAATGITVTDPLPDGVRLSGPWSCVASDGSCAAASGGAQGDALVTVDLDLQAGGQASIQIPVRFSADPSDY